MRWTMAARGIGAEVASVVSDLAGCGRSAEGNGSPSPGRLGVGRTVESGGAGGGELLSAAPRRTSVDPVPALDATACGPGSPDKDRDTVTGTVEGRDGGAVSGSGTGSGPWPVIAGVLATDGDPEDTDTGPEPSISVLSGPRPPTRPTVGAATSTMATATSSMGATTSSGAIPGAGDSSFGALSAAAETTAALASR